MVRTLEDAGVVEGDGREDGVGAVGLGQGGQGHEGAQPVEALAPRGQALAHLRDTKGVPQLDISDKDVVTRGKKGVRCMREGRVQRVDGSGNWMTSPRET